jgi:hypothetical protein
MADRSWQSHKPFLVVALPRQGRTRLDPTMTAMSKDRTRRFVSAAEIDSRIAADGE